MPKFETLIELTPGRYPLASGPALAGDVEFERRTPSWDARGAVAADAGRMHVETADGIPCLFIGRRTRNLLEPAFSPFAEVPPDWRRAGAVSLEAAGLSFGKGSVRVDAAHGPVSLALPPVTVHPADEMPLPGTAQLGAVYQFSAYLRGSGKATLNLRDVRNNVQVEKTVPLGGDWQRPCVALDGPFAERVLAASVTIEGATASV
jgi:hypothetical protein